MAKHVIMAGWDDAPHLGEQEKATLLASIPPYQRDARSKGIPQLGSGAIYPVPESEITVNDFPIPPHWPRGYGMDVGWNKTAVAWGALDRDSDILYLYSEHYKGEAEPSIHVTSIRARGAWIPGRIDPASRGRSQRDGEQLILDYQNLGLELMPAINAVESGIYKVWERLSTGRLKVFKSMQSWFGEFRIYRRDEKGHIVKVNDHLMDACVAGDTMVFTIDGPVKIKDLVGKEGIVISRCGSALRFVGARKTMVDTNVVRLKFSNGDSVVCTPDHPFLTRRGWVQAKDMAGIRCYNGVTQRNGKNLCQSLFQAPSKNFKANGIIYAVNTFRAKACGYIESFGNALTDLCREVMMFITRMKTGQITTYPTLNYSQGQTISSSINSGMEEELAMSLLKQQSNGIVLQKGVSGTSSITNKQKTNYMHAAYSRAVTVLKSMKPKLLAITDFAAITANRRPGKYPALMMKNEIAWFVAWVLWQIGMLKKKHAPDHALVNCLTVEEAGKSDVYCLTVPGASAFCIESGLVVHNTRYLVQECTTNDFMITKPIPRGHAVASIPVFDNDAGY